MGIGLAEVENDSNRRLSGLEQTNCVGCNQAVDNDIPILGIQSTQRRQ